MPAAAPPVPGAWHYKRLFQEARVSAFFARPSPATCSTGRGSLDLKEWWPSLQTGPRCPGVQPECQGVVCAQGHGQSCRASMGHVTMVSDGPTPRSCLPSVRLPGRPCGPALHAAFVFPPQRPYFQRRFDPASPLTLLSAWWVPVSPTLGPTLCQPGACSLVTRLSLPPALLCASPVSAGGCAEPGGATCGLLSAQRRRWFPVSLLIYIFDMAIL